MNSARAHTVLANTIASKENNESLDKKSSNKGKQETAFFCFFNKKLSFICCQIKIVEGICFRRVMAALVGPGDG